MNEDDLRQQAGMAVSEIVQKSIVAMMRKNGHEGTPESIFLGCNAALCALVPIAPFLAQKPKLTDREIREKGGEVFANLASYEVILLAALITSRVHGGLKATNTEDRPDIDGIEVEIVGTTNFSPEVLFDALEDWKKVTQKDPADYFNKGMLAAVEHITRGSTVPLVNFLEKRKSAAPSSNTLQ